MRKELRKNKTPTSKELFLWNMIGSSVYAFASLLLTYMTIRIVGEDEGGIFSISLTLAQMFVYIAYFEMHNFQLTDARDKYSFAEYHTVKIVNCVLMIIVCINYVLFKAYDISKMITVLLVCLYRLLDGYADVFESEFHARGRLDLAGKSMTYRTILSILVYFVVLSSTCDVIAAVIGAILSGVVGIVIFDVCVFECVGKISICFSVKRIVRIWSECFPLFVGMFLWTYLLSASRIAVDNVMPSEYQSYYQVLFLPVSVINLMAGFLIRPNLRQLTELYMSGSKKKFWKEISKMLFLIGVFTIICMIGAYLIGIPILELIVNCELINYRMLFVFLIFAGGINAAGCILYYVLTIFRQRKSIVFGYGIASLTAMFISTDFTRAWGLWGAAISYIVVVSILLFTFVICIFYNHSKCKYRIR